MRSTATITKSSCSACALECPAQCGSKIASKCPVQLCQDYSSIDDTIWARLRNDEASQAPSCTPVTILKWMNSNNPPQTISRNVQTRRTDIQRSSCGVCKGFDQGW